MQNNFVKSFEEHLQFVNSICSLMFYFSYNWKTQHHAEDICYILCERSILLEILGLNEIEESPSEWYILLDQAKKYIDDISDADKFEEIMFELSKSFICECATKTYEVSIRKPAGYNAGSLKYDAPLKELPNNHCNFHIANAVIPKSIFAERSYLPKCFLKLMDESEKKYGYDTLRTFTWLNSRPRWLELFPEEWHTSMSEPNPEIFGNLGFWGQLITAQGTFNEKNGKYVRENCNLQYQPRSSSCSFFSMRKHLESYLSKGD